MTKEEKLKKIIEKAKKNGREDKMFGFDCEIDTIDHMLFDPEFAKAYWGEEELFMRCPLNCECSTNEEHHIMEKEKGHRVCYVQPISWYGKKWQYHQHQLLTEIQAGRDPIEFLYKFIE